MILPSQRVTVRPALAAIPLSCVTIITVCPVASFRSQSMEITVSDDRESRFPVGSSRSSRAGEVTRARAMGDPLLFAGLESPEGV